MSADDSGPVIGKRRQNRTIYVSRINLRSGVSVQRGHPTPMQMYDVDLPVYGHVKFHTCSNGAYIKCLLPPPPKRINFRFWPQTGFCKNNCSLVRENDWQGRTYAQFICSNSDVYLYIAMQCLFSHSFTTYEWRIDIGIKSRWTGYYS
jgi:hypothetical protein